MVKSYLRYEPAASFGVIASPESTLSFDSSGKFLLSPALEKVGVWHVRQGVCSKTLIPSSSSSSSIAVTSIASSPSSFVAVGYADGSIRIWDLGKGSCETTLNGHKGAVTALRYNKTGSLLVSGSKDNGIILWDVVGEVGLYRLLGHRDQVTDVVFLDHDKKLVSSSKDKFLKVWDLETQHCMQTVSGHHTEIWSVDCDPEGRYLVTGSGDPELRFYSIVKHDLGEKQSLATSDPNKSVNNNSSEAEAGNKWEVLKHFGEIQRQTKDRVATLRFNKSGNLLACQMAGKTVEIFRMLDEAESKRKAKRRVHRKKEKKDKKSSKKTDDGTDNVEENDVPGEEENDHAIVVSDIFKLLHTLRSGKKICSISFCPIKQKNSLATLALSLNNNSLEIYLIKSDSTAQTLTVELPGHRSVVRSVTLSPDNSLLLTTSHNAVKIWNPSTCSCLRTIDSGYGLCSMFVPVSGSNKYALVGTKDGKIEIIDVASATCVEVVEAHGSDINSIVSIPGGRGFVTGSADHDVKFWDYDTSQKSGEVAKRCTVSNVRTMKMEHDVLKVALSPDAKYIAVALLDNNVHVFYLDTLKRRHIIYGRNGNMPTWCMDFSSDGDLLVTGSGDKNLKIWGLDFGNCHKSLFAHSDSVMDVKFVPNTHYVFSVGKDGLVKYWDADKFELLLTLEGHHAGISSLAVSTRGDFIITGSYDRSIRRWDRTEEPFFIEEEKEKRLEEMFEGDINGAFESKYAPKEELPEEGVVEAAGKKTQETLTATDLIIDALDIAEVETKRTAEHEEEKRRGKVANFQPNVLMLGLSPSDFVLRSLSNVRTSDMEQTLLALPFSDALKLLSYLKNWSTYSEKVELICRVAIVLLQTHYHQLTSTPSARPVLIDLKDLLHSRVKECKDTLGFNLAAMDHLKQLMASKSDAPFRDAKMKLLEIRSQLAKRNNFAGPTREERRKKKKPKKGTDSDGHAWTVVR